MRHNPWFQSQHVASIEAPALPAAPVRKETTMSRAIISRLAAFWREVEPGLQIDRNSFVERWDGAGEGSATAVSFEGFGITLCLFIGRTPKRDGAGQ